MANIKYIIQRLTDMNYGAMFDTISSTAKKAHKTKLGVLIDMADCAIRYGAGYVDYALFEMYNLNKTQRNTYLTRGRNNEIVKKYCDLTVFHKFVNKVEFNTLFNEYIKRDFIDVKNEPKEKVYAFFKKHDTFMVKPIDGKCGKEIFKIKKSDYKSEDEIYDLLINSEIDYELEEVIIQDERVNKMCPDCINTLRVVTLLTDEDGKSYISLSEQEKAKAKLVPHVICTYFRMGRGGKCVDNFNSGGMVAPVDKFTGVVSDVAISKAKEVYESHPQTGTKIKGFKLPYFEESLQMCKEAALKVKEMGYVGWDVGMSDKGPVFVEGNEFPGHDIYQLPVHTPEKIGMMPIFWEIFYKGNNE